MYLLFEHIFVTLMFREKYCELYQIIMEIVGYCIKLVRVK